MHTTKAYETVLNPVCSHVVTALAAGACSHQVLTETGHHLLVRQRGSWVMVTSPHLNAIEAYLC